MQTHDLVTAVVAFFAGVAGTFIVVARHPKLAVSLICRYVAKGKATLGEIHEAIDAKLDSWKK